MHFGVSDLYGRVLFWYIFKLADDGTLHGASEPANNLLDFKLSVRFIYDQIKNTIK